MKGHYVQFSKKMVVFVISAVTLLSLLSILLCFTAEDMGVVQHIMEAYTGFATVCFAAYSGNSAVEKWLIRRYMAGEAHEENRETEDRG